MKPANCSCEHQGNYYAPGNTITAFGKSWFVINYKSFKALRSVNNVIVDFSKALAPIANGSASGMRVTKANVAYLETFSMLALMASIDTTPPFQVVHSPSSILSVVEPTQTVIQSLLPHQTSPAVNLDIFVPRLVSALNYYCSKL